LILAIIQDKNFSGAFYTSKSKSTEDRMKMALVSSHCSIRQHRTRYDVAIYMYNYILEKGPSAIYYSPSRIRLVDGFEGEDFILPSNYTLERKLLKVDVKL